MRQRVRVIAFLLIAEGVYALFWLVQLLPSLGWRDRSSVALMLARGAVGAMQLSTGSGLASGRRSAASLARWALVLSAGLLTIELGWRMTPTNLDPTYRWPVVAAYWIYVGVAIWLLRRALLALEH
jgi:hypothetical protein